MAYRVGQGYDIHRLTPGRPLLLGGVALESDHGSDAHSDGDVLLHALIDALLGAAAMGDIGEHFPPSDPQYKNADSRQMLSRVLLLLESVGYRIVNVDATVFLEAPKLYPYKPRIRETVADTLGIAAGCVCIKAKTAEGFPPVGTKDAIAAAVTVLLEKN